MLHGVVTDPNGNRLPHASIQLLAHNTIVAQTSSGPDGAFSIGAARERRYILQLTPRIPARHDHADAPRNRTPTCNFAFRVGVNSPKATLSMLPRDFLPALSFSYGQAFFTEDPRTGTGSVTGTPVATAHSFQMVASKSLRSTELKLDAGPRYRQPRTGARSIPTPAYS